MHPNIGQIGLGAVGVNFVAHLVSEYGTAKVYDADPEKLDAATRLGATAAASVADVAEASDVVLLSLPSPDAVKDVTLSPNGLLSAIQPGTLIIDCSTIDPDTCRAIHAAAAAKGAGYVEAPISGGEPLQAGTVGARAKSITFMIGGDKDHADRAIEVLSKLGKHTYHLGPAGSGAIVKLISNHMAGLHNLIAAEAFVLGSAAGFSYETLLEVFTWTDAKSYMMSDYIAPRLEQNDFTPGFTVDLMHKDHRLAGELGRSLGVPLLFNSLALEAYQMMRDRKRGGNDLSDVFNLFSELAGRGPFLQGQPA